MEMTRSYCSYEVCLIQDCNLRCRYCSTGFGRWSGPPKWMSPQIIDQVVTFMIRNGGGRFKVILSGGEPLLDFGLLRYFIDQLLTARRLSGQKVLIELATNGVQLDKEVAEYLIDHKVEVTFSLDGDRETTDRNRRQPDGRGIYEIVCANVELYQNLHRERGFSNTRLRAECTIDKAANLYESVRHLFQIGFQDVIARPVANSPFTGWSGASSSANYLATFRQLVKYLLAPLDPSDIIVGHYERMLLNIAKPLQHLLLGREMGSACGVIEESVCILTDGSIVPCFMFDPVSDNNYSIGNIWSGINAFRVQNLLQSFKGVSPDCSQCPDSPQCEKGCILSFRREREEGRQADLFEYCKFVKEILSILRQEVERRYNLKDGDQSR